MNYYDGQWDRAQSKVDFAGHDTSSDLEFPEIDSCYADNEVECYLMGREKRDDFRAPSSALGRSVLLAVAETNLWIKPPNKRSEHATALSHG